MRRRLPRGLDAEGTPVGAIPRGSAAAMAQQRGLPLVLVAWMLAAPAFAADEPLPDPPESQQGPAAPLQPSAVPESTDPTSESPIPDGWAPLPPALPSAPPDDDEGAVDEVARPAREADGGTPRDARDEAARDGGADAREAGADARNGGADAREAGENEARGPGAQPPRATRDPAGSSGSAGSPSSSGNASAPAREGWTSGEVGTGGTDGSTSDVGPSHDPEALRNAAEEGDPPDPCAGAITRTPPRAREMWFDRVEQRLRRSGCRSAYWIDGLFGRVADPAEYREVSGNVAPSMLWTQYDGFDARVRFRIDLPLPQINDRLRAFVGRVDRDEFVTERAEQSGALPRQFGTIGEEQTLLGLGYRGPTQADGGGWDFGVGVRVRFPLDPYVKASYPMAWTFGEDTLVAFKPTVFYQQSEKFGVTTRIDVPHVFSDRWFGLVTASTTWSDRAQGVRGYANATLFHQLTQRSAMAMQIGLDGETQADVPLREYGVRATYRQNVWRDWLVMELRTSLTWPREKEEEERDSSWGAGIGFEMVFGPGTFRGN